MKTKESGMVLLVVVLFATLAAILVAGLYFASTSQVKSTQRQLRMEKAFNIAEAGVERAKSVLRNSHNGFSDELIGYDGVSNSYDDGLLWFGAGGAAVSLAGGTYTVKIIDDDDGDGNLLVDTNETVIVWSTGTYQGVQRVLEVAVCVPNPLYPPETVDGALALYGTNGEVIVQGSALVDGKDYALPADFFCSGAGCVGTVIATNDAVPGVYATDTTSVVNVIGAAAVEGDPPTDLDGGGDNTQQDWIDVANDLIPYAQLVINGGVIAGQATLGTREQPCITVMNGNVKITGNVDGAGILIIVGGVDIDLVGTFHYEGIVIMLGDGFDDPETEFQDHGNATIFGAVVGLGDNMDFTPHGSPEITYSTEALANLRNILPPDELQVVYWREIK
ncbi:hypothetical protein ACFLQR_01540 [Verrucomicrobiota bacterium]